MNVSNVAYTSSRKPSVEFHLWRGWRIDFSSGFKTRAASYILAIAQLFDSFIQQLLRERYLVRNVMGPRQGKACFKTTGRRVGDRGTEKTAREGFRPSRGEIRRCLVSTYENMGTGRFGDEVMWLGSDAPLLPAWT